MEPRPTAGMTTGTQAAKRMTQCLLGLFVLGNCALGYGAYNQELKSASEPWLDVVHGTALAPEQYRVGVVMSAYWLTQHTRLRLSEVFGLFDLVASLVTVLMLYKLLTRSRGFAHTTLAGRWFGSAAFLALVMYLMAWTGWYHKVETLPTACGVTLLLWLWTPAGQDETRSTQAVRAAGVLLVAVALAFVRADVAMMVCVGVGIGSAAGISPELSLPRRAAVALSLMAAVAVGLVQLWLMKDVYPQATYGDVHVWMIAHDWWKLQRWGIVGLFLTPFLWTVWQAWKGRYFGEGAGGAFLLAACGHAALWFTFGRLDEVRIFLPMAMGVLPLTVELAMRKLDSYMGSSEYSG